MDKTMTTKIVATGTGVLKVFTDYVDDVCDDFQEHRYIRGSLKVVGGVLITGGTGYLIANKE
jgi:hypothetical protein